MHPVKKVEQTGYIMYILKQGSDPDAGTGLQQHHPAYTMAAHLLHHSMRITS